MGTYLKCRILHDNYNKSDNVTYPFVPEEVANLMYLEDKLEIKLNGHVYQRNLLYLENEILFNRIRKYWKCAEHHVLTGTATINNIVNIKEVINLLAYTHYNLQESKNKGLETNTLKCVNLFKNTIRKINEIDEDILNTLTTSAVVIEEEPVSHYFHNYFLIFYLILSLEKLCGSEGYQKTYESVMLDLVRLSEVIFEKHKNNLLRSQPFVCLCVKNLWIHLMQNSNTSIPTFWMGLNRCVEGRNEEYCVWLLKHLTYVQIHGLNESVKKEVMNEDPTNIVLINRVLQSTISQIYSDSKLLNILKLLNPIVTEMWIEHMKLDPYQILWDHFYKNLNKSGQNITFPKSIFDFKDILDNIIGNPDSLQKPYEYYLYLLHKHLVKHPLHWKKLQGRIYSRLPEQKVREFNENAVYNIALLFFTFLSLNIQEIWEKLCSILENLSKKQRDTEFVWILHINMVNMAVAQNQDLLKISTTLRNLVQNASNKHENFYLIRHFVQGINIVFTSDNLTLNQNCLLGPWISSYMLKCSHSDLCVLLQLLIDIVKKTGSLGKWNTYKPIYLESVIPTLKQISLTANAPHIGKLAGIILMNVPDLNSNLIPYFCGETINVNVTNEFLTTILEDAYFTGVKSQQESVLIAAWCRISLLSSDTISHSLSMKIFNLSAIKSVVTIENCEEPFVDFIKAINKQVSAQNQVFRLKELCETCFGNIDKWISNYLTPSTLDSQVLYLFTKMSLLFYYCAPLLYQKSKSICLLNRLVTVLLLPTEVLMGKPLSPNILHAIEKTWHLFMKGIFKLDYVSDPYIDRTLKDLIIRYIPHFSTSNTPIINILDNAEITTYTLEKITNSFLLHSARSSEENTFKALKTIQRILQVSFDLPRIQNITKKVLPGVFEVVLFNSQKSTALDLISFITSSEWYPHVHEEIQTAINNITAKHLAFNTSNYFQLLSILQKCIPEDVQAILPQIKEQIKHVERMRGVGFDNTLRQALKRIEDTVSQQKSN